jgi:SAM-dependent methyltransferase
MLRQATKAIVRRIPAIDRLIRQRDSLLEEVEQLRCTLANDRQPAPAAPAPQRDRRDIILEQVNLDGLGLEIGPSYNPLVPKSQGYHVETIDHADATHLREKYRTLTQDVSRIEEVDYVSGGASIFKSIGKPGRYDYIIASHVIEHVPDMLGFLKDCERLLKPAGRLSLAIPDKRYCFDIFQSLTTTGHLLETHATNARRPSPGVLFDFIANYGKRGDQDAWIPEYAADVHFPNELAHAKAEFDRVRRSKDYVDTHIWRFVPSSFRLIMSDLHALREISLREVSFTPTIGFEFFVTASREADGVQLDRLTLAKQSCTELAALSFS